MLFFAIILSQIPLDDVNFKRFDRLESNRFGHFLYCWEKTFHFDIDGALLESVPRLVVSIAPLDNGYVYSFYDNEGMGTALLIDDEEKVFRNKFTRLFIPAENGFFITQKKWVPGHFLRRVNIADKITPTGPDFFYIERPDPNLKYIWAVEKNGQVFVSSQLDNKVSVFSSSGEYIAQVAINLPWRPHPGFLRDASGERKWRESFDLPVGFGSVRGGFLFAVESKGGTDIHLLDPNLKVVRSKRTTGWMKNGLLFSGCDGTRGWLFNPESMSVSVIRF